MPVTISDRVDDQGWNDCMLLPVRILECYGLKEAGTTEQRSKSRAGLDRGRVALRFFALDHMSDDGDLRRTLE